MKVYALVGASGTGKSYQAMNVCRDNNIEAIIDDGLFICSNRVMAGISAKKQPTKIGAVKTALFTRDEHRDNVAEAIARINPASLLVIGTSDGMIGKITARLEIPEPSITIYIEDITTPAEREIAGKQRNEMGMHVIPAPTFQLKKDFSGYLLNPLQIFRGNKLHRASGTRSVVRPTYSYRGDYMISDRVLADIILRVGRDIQELGSVLKVVSIPTPTGVEISVTVNMKKGVRIIDAARTLQRKAKLKIEDMTAINIEKLDVYVKGIR